MSTNIEGQQCPVCHAYLFEDDDIVYCPECGAPHHRDCYHALGHCGLEQDHGTDRQYDRVQARAAQRPPEPAVEQPREESTTPGTVRCRMCGEEFDDGRHACPRCGAPRLPQAGGYMMFDLLGGVPADMDIGEGVTAEQAKRFVIANTPRYIQKFAAMTVGKKTSWNWLAFLFPWAWFASRKMYLYALITGIIGVASGLLMQSFTLAVYSLGISTQPVSSMQLINEAVSQMQPGVLIAASLGVLIAFVLRIICGIFADGVYRKHVISGVKRINAESEDADADYRKFGGINFWALFLAIFAVEYLPAIIAGFFL